MLRVIRTAHRASCDYRHGICPDHKSDKLDKLQKAYDETVKSLKKPRSLQKFNAQSDRLADLTKQMKEEHQRLTFSRTFSSSEFKSELAAKVQTRRKDPPPPPFQPSKKEEVKKEESSFYSYFTKENMIKAAVVVGVVFLAWKFRANIKQALGFSAAAAMSAAKESPQIAPPPPPAPPKVKIPKVHFNPIVFRGGTK